jgi:hypothetical protein
MSCEWLSDEMRNRPRDFVANEIQMLAAVRVLNLGNVRFGNEDSKWRSVAAVG